MSTDLAPQVDVNLAIEVPCLNNGQPRHPDEPATWLTSTLCPYCASRSPWVPIGEDCCRILLNLMNHLSGECGACLGRADMKDAVCFRPL